MKKYFIGSFLAFAALVIVAPSASAAENRGRMVNAAEQKQKAIEKCEKRLGGIKSSAALFDTYRNSYYVKPADTSAYPTTRAVVLGGGVQTFNSAKAASGPSKNRINYVLVNERFKGSSAIAAKSFYKAGANKDKAAFDVGPLNKEIAALDKSIALWSGTLEKSSASFTEGAPYTKDQEYGAGNLGAREQDKSLKAPNTFTVSFNSAQCTSTAGRQNVKFLNQRRAVMIRAAKAGLVDTKKAVADARVEYKKIAAKYKSERANIQYRP